MTPDFLASPHKAGAGLPLFLPPGTKPTSKFPPAGAPETAATRTSSLDPVRTWFLPLFPVTLLPKVCAFPFQITIELNTLAPPRPLNPIR